MKNHKIIFLLILLSYSCSKKHEFIQVTKGFSENIEEPRVSILINDELNIFFCIEKSKEGEYNYFKSKLSKVQWFKIKTTLLKNFKNRKFEKYAAVHDLSKTELIFDLDETEIYIEDISYLIMKQQETQIINEILNLIDLKSAQKIDFFEFKTEILFEKMPIPPPSERKL
jgi:hypothetical protein